MSDVLSLARTDFAAYIAAFSPRFQMPRHVRLLVEKVEALVEGRANRLLISMPPRHGKSETVSAHGPAWFLGRFPERSVIFSSYSAELAEDFGRRVRNVLASPLHQRIFPGSQLSGDSAAASKLAMTAGGAYFAVGRGGALIGRGADWLIIDDPLKDREEAVSPTIRRQMKEWFTTTAYTRLAPGGVVWVISSRWSEDDLIGWLQREHAGEGWEVLNLPALAEENDPLGRAEGEALWPERYPVEVLQRMRMQIGSAAFAAVYQGRPAALEGTIFRREWWKTYRELPALESVVISCDSAFKAGASNDYSVLEVWGVSKTGFFLLDLVRRRLEFPELRQVAEQLAEKWAPRAFLIEDRASGQSLIQALRRDTRLPVLPIKVSADKESRAHAVTPLLEAGRVYLPDVAPWLIDFIEELSSFPAAPHDDMVDACTQALNYLREKGRCETIIRVGAADDGGSAPGGRVEHWMVRRAREAAEEDARNARRRREGRRFYGF